MNRSQGLMSYSEIRATARKFLKGSWSKFFLLMMIFVVASNFFSLNSLSGYVMNNSASDETASIMVVHTSGLSWDGEIPSPEVSERSVYSLEEFLLGTTSVRSYSLKDFIRTIATGGFVGLLECLPSDFWIVLFVLSLATLLLPMMNYGLAVNYRRRMQGDVPQASALFRWKMLPRCVIADVIRFGPVFLLRPLAEESSIYTTILILYYAAILFFGILEYVWSMRYYIWAESPDKGIIAVLRESRLRMRGHKFRLFALRLTFIGWIMLYSFGSSAINLIVSALGLPGIISTALNLCGYIWLNVYQQMSEMVFFDNLCHPGTIVTDGEEDDIPSAKNSSIHIRSSNESVAWSILSSHKYSHQAIKNEGIWEEYQALGIDPSVEIEWLKKYARFLCDEYTQNPGTLDDILQYASEYGDTFSVSRVVNTLGRYVDHESQPAWVLLEHCAKVVSAINSDSFADHKKFAFEKKELIGDMADRLEFRLNTSDPNGNWRDVLATVRAGCIE